MSDQSNGPVMLVLTSVLKQEGATIGRIGPNVTLPRPVRIKVLFAVLGGILGGILIALPFSFGNPIRAIMVGATFGGAAAYLFTNYSPWKGESMTKFLSTTAAARLRSMEVDGRRVTVAIGVCPINRVAEGQLHFVPGAVNIAASQFDERGVQISEKNRNLDRIRSPQLAAMLLGDAAGSGAGLDLPSEPEDRPRRRFALRRSETPDFDDAPEAPSRRPGTRSRRDRPEAPNDAPPWVTDARRAARPSGTPSGPGTAPAPSPAPPSAAPTPQTPTPPQQAPHGPTPTPQSPGAAPPPAPAAPRQPAPPSAPPVQGPSPAPPRRPGPGPSPRLPRSGPQAGPSRHRSERPNGRPPWERDDA